MEKEIKTEIANFFLNDSRDFLKRYEILSALQSDVSTRSKLLIDIVFSMECSLKALVFIESSKDERETYKEIRKCSHNLKKLISKVNTDAISDILSVINENIHHFDIGSRYSLEANIHFRDLTESDRLYYSTIADHKWLGNLFSNAKKLYSHVESQIDNSPKTINLAHIDLEKEIAKRNRIKKVGSKSPL